MTARVPDHEAIFAAASFEAMPPLPRPEPRRTGGDGQQRVIGQHLADQFGRRVGPGIRGEQSGSIGQQHQEIGVHVVCHQRCDAIVVAVAQFVTGDRVVLVDDRDAAQFDQSQQRLAGVQILPAVDEIVGHEQHLRGDEIDVEPATGCTCP